VAWRGMVPEAALDAATRAVFGDAITYYVYANSHILVYAIPGPDGSVTPGERLINFVWYRNYLEGPDLDDLLTDNAGQRRDISMPPGVASERHVAEMRAVAAARLPAPMARLVAKAAQPFLQVIYDIEVPRMAFGRVCLIGDAAFAVRPHAAAGTAKAAADAWALAEAIASGGDVATALARWEPGQVALGAQLLERTRRIGRRSQFDGTWVPGDPDLIFGLRGPGR
jgi:2,6-dihydroxypyridine 3-monooxygenase